MNPYLCLVPYFARAHLKPRLAGLAVYKPFRPIFHLARACTARCQVFSKSCKGSGPPHEVPGQTLGHSCCRARWPRLAHIQQVEYRHRNCEDSLECSESSFCRTCSDDLGRHDVVGVPRWMTLQP